MKIPGTFLKRSLRQSEERYRAVCSNIPGMVYSAGKDWSLRFVCNAESFCGTQADALVSGALGWQDIVHPDDLMDLRRTAEALEKRPRSLTQEYRIVAADGTVRWVSDHKSSRFNAHGEFDGVDGVVLDITARKLAEESLTRSEVFHRTLFEGAAEGILVADATTRRFSHANPAICELLGYTTEEIVGRSVSILAPSQQPDDLYVEIQKTLSAGKAWRGETLNRRKDGSLYHEEMTITPVDAQSGAFTHQIAIKKDITQRIEMQSRLQQQQKLASIGTLASGMAHEINNPVMGIMNYANFVLDKLGPESPVAEFATEIRHESRRVATMTHSLLAVAQDRSRQQHMALAAVGAILATILPAVDTEARKRGVDLACDVPVDLPPVACRKAGIGQLLSALLANAIEAVDGTPTGHDADKIVRVSAQAIAECGRRKGNGGVLNVESKVGEWTRFHIVLPINITPAADTAEQGGSNDTCG